MNSVLRDHYTAQWGGPISFSTLKISAEGQLCGEGLKYTTPLLADGYIGEIIGTLITLPCTFTLSCTQSCGICLKAEGISGSLHK